MKLVPLYDRVIVKPFEEEQKSSSKEEEEIDY